MSACRREREGWRWGGCEIGTQKNNTFPPPPHSTLTDLNITQSCREVVDKGAAAVLDEVEASMYAIAQSVLAGDGFSFDVPSRAKGNQLYVPQLDRIVLKDSTSSRPFASTATCRKAVITARILGLVHELCAKRIHVTKRDLFYTDVKLFEVREDGWVGGWVGGGGGGGRRESTAITHTNQRALLVPPPLLRTKPTPTPSWTTSPACWAAPGHPCTWWRPKRGWWWGG